MVPTTAACDAVARRIPAGRVIHAGVADGRALEEHAGADDALDLAPRRAGRLELGSQGVILAASEPVAPADFDVAAAGVQQHFARLNRRRQDSHPSSACPGRSSRPTARA